MRTNKVASEEVAASIPIDNSYQALILLYSFILAIISPLTQAKISEKFEASWIFYANPLQRIGALRYGQLMAVWTMFFFPLAAVLYPIVLIIWGIELLPDVVLSCGSTLIISMIYQSLDKSFPFSKDKQTGGGENIGPMLLTIFMVPFFGFGHYFLAKIPYLTYGGTLVVWVVVWLMLLHLRRKEQR
ncbi:MAG: hypothetical protein AAFQ37_04135 [Bacteroidota bacterium]